MTDVVPPATPNHRDAPSPGCPPPHPSPRRPRRALPAGSCDSHCHVFGPPAQFPYAEQRTFTPVAVSRQVVAARQAFLGFDRAVIVQSSCYGTDHAALVDALAADPQNRRGVAIVTPATRRAELETLHSAGVRGGRLHFLPHLGAAPDATEQRQVLTKIADAGWHAEIHVHGTGITEHERMIASIPSPVVIDHMARVDLDDGLDSPAVHSLLRLLEAGNTWVKLSGADRVSTTGEPYGDALELAALLARHAPERVLWGTDFPHVNIVGDAPDDGLLVDLVEAITPGETGRRLMLVENPALFFDF